MRPKFFQEDLNINAEEFRQYLPVNVNTDFDVLAPSIADAETKYIMPILGEPLTHDLKEYYEGESHEDEVRNRLIERIQSATIRIAYYESFDLLSVNITETGIQDLNGDNRVYRYQADRAKDALARQAFEHLQYFYDALVSSGLRTWEPSDPSNPRPANSVFRNYSEFFQAAHMDADFRLFAKLAQWIHAAEQVTLPYRVGRKIADSIIARDSRITPFILSAAQRLVAFAALSQACAILHGYLTADGVVVRSMRTDGPNAGYSTTPADHSTRKELAKTYAELSESAATELVTLLQADTTAFPEILDVDARDNVRTHIPSRNKKSYRV